MQPDKNSIQKIEDRLVRLFDAPYRCYPAFRSRSQERHVAGWPAQYPRGREGWIFRDAARCNGIFRWQPDR